MFVSVRTRPEGLAFSWPHRAGPRKGELDWKLLQYYLVLRVLHNPRYVGCITYGRCRDRKLPYGKTVTTMLPREEWIAFIPSAHPGYITPDGYEANLARLAGNAATNGCDRVVGTPREEPALLQDIICGKCGNRMTVRYHTRRGKQALTYAYQREGISPTCGQDKFGGRMPCAGKETEPSPRR
jgi:hypothetical protein